MNPRIIAKRLRVLYDAVDPAAKAAVEAHPNPVSCKDGCSGCCYQMTGITLPEGFLLAKVALDRPDWLELAKKMREASLPLLTRITRRDYFKKAIPCVFLDTATERCTVYAERPSACRYHYVITPAADCYPAAGSKGTRALNMISFDRHFWEFNAEVMGQAAGAGAPIQLTTLFCMRLMADEPRRAALLELTEGLLNPNEWTLWALDGGVPDLAESSDEKRAISKLLRGKL